MADGAHVKPAQTWMTNAMISFPSHGSRYSRLRSATAFATLSIAMAAVVACSAAGAPVASAPPSESPAPTQQPVVSPSADPSVAPSPSADPADPSEPPAPSDEPGGSPFVPAELGPDRIGRVIATDGLRVRSLPTIGEESERLDPTLDEGTRFYVVDGPVMADGYAWFQVDPYGVDAGTPFGWIAAGSRDGQAWIENHLDGCDSIGISVQHLAGQPDHESLYWYGVQDLPVEGTLFCAFGDVEGLTTGPEWIEFDRYCVIRDGEAEFAVRGQAATSLLDQGAPVEGRYIVTGHFDDAGARECQGGGGIDGPSPEPAEVVLFCRMQFVATEVRPA